MKCILVDVGVSYSCLKLSIALGCYSQIQAIQAGPGLKVPGH